MNWIIIEGLSHWFEYHNKFDFVIIIRIARDGLTDREKEREREKEEEKMKISIYSYVFITLLWYMIIIAY